MNANNNVRLFAAATDFDGIEQIAGMSIYALEDGVPAEIEYESSYSDENQTFRGEITHFSGSRGYVAIDNGNDEQRIVRLGTDVENGDERKIGSFVELRLARPGDLEDDEPEIRTDGGEEDDENDDENTVELREDGEPADAKYVSAEESDGQVTLTYEFEADGEDDAELVFRVSDRYENAYGDDKVAVETPAPWDTPDSVTSANEVVKTLEWEEAHYEFSDKRDAWTIDADAVDDLRENAEDEGYTWEDAADFDNEDNEAAVKISDIAEFAKEGDHITVTYDKKNGNGTNTYEGEVRKSIAIHNGSGVGVSSVRQRTSIENARVVFEDEDGKTKTLKTGENGDAGLFSSGYHPYMGNVVSARLTYDDVDDRDDGDDENDTEPEEDSAGGDENNGDENVEDSELSEALETLKGSDECEMGEGFGKAIDGRQIAVEYTKDDGHTALNQVKVVGSAMYGGEMIYLSTPGERGNLMVVAKNADSFARNVYVVSSDEYDTGQQIGHSARVMPADER